MKYNPNETDVLRAGLAKDPERSEVWGRNRSTVDDFIRRGLIKSSDLHYADGRVERFPVHLTDFGFSEARSLPPKPFAFAGVPTDEQASRYR
jgi:hypothetical protein